MTKRIWQIHSWLGLICGLGLLVIGATGSLLVFGPEMESLLAPEPMAAHPVAQERLSFDALYPTVRGALAPADRITGWTIASNPRLPDAVSVTTPGDRKFYSLKIDPYNGKTVGHKQETERTLTGWLLNLHYTFLAGTAGTLVAGLLAVGLCLLGLTGLWLYRNFWKNFFTLRWRRSARIFFSDLHKMIGISSVAFNLALGFTGAYWNLPSAYRSLTSGSGEISAPAKAIGPAVPETATLPIDEFLQRASDKLPGFRPSYLALPTAGDTSFTAYGSVPTLNPLRGPYGSRATFDTVKGELTAVRDVRQAGWWEQVEDTFVPVHYGTFGGWPVKVLWCAGGLSPGILTLSGLLLWRARTRGKRRQSTRAVPSFTRRPAKESMQVTP